jgi:hypothetical protein
MHCFNHRNNLAIIITKKTMGDFKVGVSVGVCCTKCTLNTGVNTNFEITQCNYTYKRQINLMIEAVCLHLDSFLDSGFTHLLTRMRKFAKKC